MTDYSMYVFYIVPSLLVLWLIWQDLFITFFSTTKNFQCHRELVLPPSFVAFFSCNKCNNYVANPEKERQSVEQYRPVPVHLKLSRINLENIIFPWRMYYICRDSIIFTRRMCFFGKDSTAFAKIIVLYLQSLFSVTS